jgi:osmoprotectant transport system substrate-binding protein
VRSRPLRPVGVAVLLVVLLAGCTSGPDVPEGIGDAGRVRFAAYDFPENQILVAVYAEAARRAGVRVSVQDDAGTREVVQPALQQGVVDVVVDYLGTALDFSRPDQPAGQRAPEAVHAELARTLGGRGVTVLAPAAAEDQNGFAVTTAFAQEHQVTRLSDLAPLAAGLTFGGPPECPDRPLCLPGLREVYGLRFAEVRSMSSRAATVEALVAGEIDVGLLETTDARRFSAPVILLIDDRSLQPHENVVPLVRTAVLDRWGDLLRTALDETSARLTDQELVALNRAVEVDGLTPQEAARQWWARQ